MWFSLASAYCIVVVNKFFFHTVTPFDAELPIYACLSTWSRFYVLYIGLSLTKPTGEGRMQERARSPQGDSVVIFLQACLWWQDLFIFTKRHRWLHSYIYGRHNELNNRYILFLICLKCYRTVLLAYLLTELRYGKRCKQEGWLPQTDRASAFVVDRVKFASH